MRTVAKRNKPTHNCVVLSAPIKSRVQRSSGGLERVLGVAMEKGQRRLGTRKGVRDQGQGQGPRQAFAIATTFPSC